MGLLGEYFDEENWVNNLMKKIRWCDQNVNFEEVISENWDFLFSLENSNLFSW